MAGVPVRCPLGGLAPCIDDLCHSGGTTICGLEPDYDFCEHDCVPETCDECNDFDDGEGERDG